MAATGGRVWESRRWRWSEVVVDGGWALESFELGMMEIILWWSVPRYAIIGAPRGHHFSGHGGVHCQLCPSRVQRSRRRPQSSSQSPVFFARVSKYRLLNFLLPAYPLIIQLTFGRDARPWKYVCSDADCRAGGVRRPLNEPPGAENRQELTETGSQICAQTTPRRILSGTHSRCNVHLAERLIRSLWLSADLYILSAFLPEGHLADHEYRRTTR